MNLHTWECYCYVMLCYCYCCYYCYCYCYHNYYQFNTLVPYLNIFSILLPYLRLNTAFGVLSSDCYDCIWCIVVGLLWLHLRVTIILDRIFKKRRWRRGLNLCGQAACCLFCNKCTLLLTINLFETQSYPADGTYKCSRNIGCTSKIDAG